MTRHTRVGLVRQRVAEPSEPPDPAVLQTQLQALATAVEQLADAIDVLIPETPTAYADDHVRRAREELHAVWGATADLDPGS